ncbi:hypothetical protein T01_1031 [Trichinella spiralis]|uniref:Uncharacterized protein n=1 Tax=Trichinella spiralis TaxID=6334 RepID=A0A0V1BDW5_TRISP|nr:hypothetical protein T01_1031 [Trichinella spiralis]
MVPVPCTVYTLYHQSTTSLLTLNSTAGSEKATSNQCAKQEKHDEQARFEHPKKHQQKEKFCRPSPELATFSHSALRHGSMNKMTMPDADQSRPLWGTWNRRKTGN